MRARGLSVLATLDSIAAKHATVPATVALAWLSAQPNIGGPVASATSTEQLLQLLSSVDLQLDSEDLKRLATTSQ